MFYQNVIAPYIRLTEQNPDQTVARIDGQVYSYAQFAQRIAPIMNELDAMSISRTGIVMKQDLTACAALMACLFSGVVAVPLPENLPENRLKAIQQELELPQMLTVERMHYYYRMTFEDAHQLYGKYVGNWGDAATVYRFDAVKDGKIVLHGINPQEKVVVDFQVSGRQNYAMGVEVSGNQE